MTQPFPERSLEINGKLQRISLVFLAGDRTLARKLRQMTANNQWKYRFLHEYEDKTGKSRLRPGCRLGHAMKRTIAPLSELHEVK